MRTLISFAGGLALTALSTTAMAATIWTESVTMSTQAGVCTVDFDGSVCAGVNYSDLDANSRVTGSISGVQAQPVGSTGFYLTVGPTAGTPNTITVAGLGNYFGFLAGSLDTYNLIEFSLVGGGTLSFTGGQIAAAAGFAADGNRSRAIFWNLALDSGQTYDKITLTSTQNAFETDNHAFGTVSVPEPATLALLGLGLAGLGVTRRQRRR